MSMDQLYQKPSDDQEIITVWGLNPVAWGAFAVGTAVAMGAFGTHVLATRLEPSLLEIFKTGAQYHMTQGLAILVHGVWWQSQSQRRPWAPWIHRALLGGVALFSGSLYTLAFTGVKAWGMVTPLGGLLLLVAWALWVWDLRGQASLISK